MNSRAKWAYLSYNSMLEKIADGTLDEYDVIYCKDTKENYVVSPELVPWAIKSKIYVFNSIEEANTILNENTDTYVGQIISILNNNTYKGYIVNKDENENYSATPLTNDNIDYNNLGNRPIYNLVGTLENRIIVSALSTGIYNIKGNYKISIDDVTEYVSASGDLFLIEKSDSEMYVKRFTKDSIYDFVIDDNGITKKKYITEDYLESKGYSTINYVDAKMIALEESIKADIKGYVAGIVESVIEEKVETIIGIKLDEKLDELIEATTDEEVKAILTN